MLDSGRFISHAQKATAVQYAAPTENLCGGRSLPGDREKRGGGEATAPKHLSLSPSPATLRKTAVEMEMKGCPVAFTPPGHCQP